MNRLTFLIKTSHIFALRAILNTPSVLIIFENANFEVLSKSEIVGKMEWLKPQSMSDQSVETLQYNDHRIRIQGTII